MLSGQEDLIGSVDRMLKYGLDDPYPVFARLRSEAPILEFGDHVLVSGYDGVRQVCSDSEHFLSNHNRPGTVEWEAVQPSVNALEPEVRERYDEVVDFCRMLVPQSIGPEYARRRAVFRRAFNAQALAQLEVEVQEVVDSLIDTLREQETPDFVADFAYRVGQATNMRMLGMPDADSDRVNEWKRQATAFFKPDGMQAIDSFHAALCEFREYTAERVAAARSDPGTMPFLPVLIEALDAGEVDNGEVAAMLSTVLLTASETTMGFIATGILTLMRNRSEWRRLCERPDLASLVAEECLRFETPIQGLGRNPAPGARVGEVPIRTGTRVVALIASANRDESVFENPDRFDITRRDGRNKLSFALGPHQCPGAVLARTQGRIAFATLARRCPAMELVNDEVEWRAGPMLRSPARLRVQLN